jgi:type VI secretion system secreted protein VgrG
VDIIDAVLAEYASSARVEKKLSGSYTPRPYTVQYRESDYDFVTRLMEEEGIYYYFTHASERHTLVLTDGPNGHAPMTGANLTWSAKVAGRHLREDLITQWNHAHHLRSLKYTHTDYTAGSPTADMSASATRSPPYSKPNDLEVYDYPGGHDDGAMAGNAGSMKQKAKHRAQLRVDAFESGDSVATGLTSWRDLVVGSTFTFKDHPTDAGGYLVTSVAMDMEFAGYEANPDDLSTSYDCRFDAVPKATAFQPERVAKAPEVGGPQTATVVGPHGDEIHTDKYGRVKVLFHWDRLNKAAKDEKSSCWVRVAQPWAGKGFGFISLPRIGDEVVVEFLEGNPDRPLITGRVYNADNMPPYALPAQATVSGIKTRSSKGGQVGNANELRFDDKKGSEYVLLQAEKDHLRTIKNDSFDTIGGNHDATVTKNLTLSVGENTDVAVGKKATLDVGADTAVTLGADFLLDVAQALGLSAGAAIAIKAAQALAASAGAGMDFNAGTALNLTGGTTVHIKGSMGVVIDGGMTLTIKAGTGSVVLGPDGVSITGPLVKVNSGGSPGSASAAAKAKPPKPPKPKKPADNKDPIA